MSSLTILSYLDNQKAKNYDYGDYPKYPEIDYESYEEYEESE